MKSNEARKEVRKKAAMTMKEKRAAKKAAKSAPTAIVRSDVDRHAKALAAVRAAMSRKEPPSLRALGAELAERGIEKPRGGTDWMPSSIQSLMRQAGYDAGGLKGKEVA